MQHKLNHYSLVVPYMMAIVASMMNVREGNRPAGPISAGERTRRRSRARMQKQSRRRNRR